MIATLLGVPAGWLLAAVALLVFAEDALFVGFVVPGETAAVVAGAAASLGRASLPVVLVVVAAAAVLGDSVGYLVGRRLGPRLLQARPLRRHAAGLEKGRDLVERRGGAAVFLGRFTAFLRAVTPALAGAARMPYRRFLPWNLLGGLTWATAAVLVGYAAGASFARAAQTLGRDSALVALAVVAVAGTVVAVRRHRSSRPARHDG
ncbi:membrane protein DedA with SNARE-associated domain [Kineococcus rhizosphaerae]|uniref:Membrane protein DedA with SNARE-associated domain n=1 Tax=Kineococcus rhizosphaerae TaxID=559628 RepID=A0A2T0QXM2_9ACTN|nr:membrane protein DedA with SNARE-associated domain [Kineococcus rhizosphaerae]